MAAEPQFGTPEPGRTHRDRPAAFGLLVEQGKIALVEVTLDDGTPPFLDLPGGAVDPGEDAPQALVREFAEETGLCVAAGSPIACAAQYFVTSHGEAVNNRCDFQLAQRTEGSAMKIEDSHMLVWKTPDECLRLLRHDAHAWAVLALMRARPSQA